MASTSSSVPSGNPQATVPEGLAMATVTTKAPILSAQPAFPILSPQTPQSIQPAQPVIPSIPSFGVPALRPPNSSTNRNYNSSPLLRGPIPQKGSGQDRFRQQLLKENDYSPSAATDRSRPYIAPTVTGTVQRLLKTPQRYCLWPAPFALEIILFSSRGPAADYCPSTRVYHGQPASLHAQRDDVHLPRYPDNRGCFTCTIRSQGRNAL